MTTGRGFIVCAATCCAVLSSCSSTSLVACKTEADCAPYAGTVCYEGYCRKPNTISGDVDFAMMSVPDDMAATPEPPDLSLFCGDGGLTSCPASTPVCDDNECRACTSADDSVCAARSILTPTCDVTSGSCMACRTDHSAEDCTDSTLPVCGVDGACHATCTTDADCASGFCDLGGMGLSKALCARAEEIVYVSAASECFASTGAGTQASPFCAIDQATAKLPLGGFIQLMASTFYLSPALTPLTRPFAIRGGSNTMIAGAGISSSPAVNGIQLNGASVLLETIGFQNISGHAIDCTQSSAVISNVGVNAAATGINASTCTLTMDRLEVTNGGLGLASDKPIKMTNSIFAANTGTALDLGNAMGNSQLSFLTLYANGASDTTKAGAIICDTTGFGVNVPHLTSSLLWANQLVGGVSVSGPSVLSGNDLDFVAAGNTNLEPAIRTGKSIGIQPPALWHLYPGDSANIACCFDKASTGPNHDIDGQARPIGAGYDIGADEVQ